MRILVTGGAGFIGSHIVDAYLAAGHEVTVVDDLSTGRKHNLNAKASFQQLDIRDRGLRQFIAAGRFEVINHHAAQISVKVSTEDPLLDAEVNVLGLLNVLQAAAESGVRKVIFASSGGTIYGGPERLPIDEGYPYAPESPYGCSKAAGELYLRCFAKERGLGFTALRYSNVYGPRQDPHGEAGVVAIFARKVLAGDTPVIHWDGEQSRDFVYVGDVARASLLALSAGDGEGLNIGTGVPTTVNQLYQGICDAAGRRIEPQYGPRRPGDLRTSYLDAAKAQQVLGWQPEVALADGLARTVEYFRQEAVAGARS